MNILLIGSGGREHAIAKKLSESQSTDKLYCYPGNPGIMEIGHKTDIAKMDFQQILNFCNSNSIELVVVGPEKPLAEGISDVLTCNGIKVFGPSKEASRLESSKGFAKDFMLKYNIPTANYKIFNSNDKTNAIDYLEKCNYPIVLKADGLAAGKGVIIADNIENANQAISQMFEGIFDNAGKTVVIEEFLEGEEASILAISDGNDFITLPSSQDHKRALDGDKGKNTGGMGAYSPAPVVTSTVMNKVNERILKPALDGMKREGSIFIGCLYAGLMINKGEPKVVEFNVRFGDPETQAVLSLFEGDFAGLLYSAANGNIDKSKMIDTSDKHSCCVILASKGYPDNYKKGFEIKGIDKAIKSGAIVFHSGTKRTDNILISDGGRVLGVTCVNDTLKKAVEQTYNAVSEIYFTNMYYRKDIGYKAL
ncbi:MAG: phosphoribosylamine--glycine ligase [Ignavibacteriae bacterium]|nr:phosphoribosylamine--glycine ligase [Ignavibacteriota bacterium]